MSEGIPKIIIGGALIVVIGIFASPFIAYEKYQEHKRDLARQEMTEGLKEGIRRVETQLPPGVTLGEALRGHLQNNPDIVRQRLAEDEKHRLAREEQHRRSQERFNAPQR